MKREARVDAPQEASDDIRRLTVIDSGHWLAVLLLQGAIIGRMGV